MPDWPRVLSGFPNRPLCGPWSALRCVSHVTHLPSCLWAARPASPGFTATNTRSFREQNLSYRQGINDTAIGLLIWQKSEEVDNLGPTTNKTSSSDGEISEGSQGHFQQEVFGRENALQYIAVECGHFL